MSPSVAALGQDERQEIVVYRGRGAAAGCLITARSDSGVTVHRLGIAKSSVPVVAEIGGSTLRYQIAFQANTSRLWTTGSFGTHDLGLGMAAGTSPAITGSRTYDLAFQANTGLLWTAGDIGTRSLHLAMAAGTSPSIASVPGGDRIAYQGRNGNLWITDLVTRGSLIVGHDQGLGMMRGTSPSLTGEGNGYHVAFQANTGELYTTGDAGKRNLHYRMDAATSPASYRDEIVFSSIRHRIYDVTDAGKTIQVLPVSGVAGSTPALTVVASATPAGAHRQYGSQIAYAAAVTGGSPDELTAGVVNRLFDIP